MKTITIRDLRQRWPEAEAALKTEEEIIITRDSRPVARLVRVASEKTRRKRWDPEEHALRIRRVLGNRTFPAIDAEISRSRADRDL